MQITRQSFTISDFLQPPARELKWFAGYLRICEMRSRSAALGRSATEQVFQRVLNRMFADLANWHRN